MERATDRAGMVEGLIAATHLLTLEQFPAVVAENAARVGWSEVLIWVVDVEERTLYPLTGAHEGFPGEVDGAMSVDGTVAGRAYRDGSITPAEPSGVRQWWVPLLDGTERVGVMRVTSVRDTVLDDEVKRDLKILAGLVALVLLRKAPTSDTFAHLIRRRSMSVNAEMEWWLMPPRTFATERVLVSAVLEPAYEVSGDAFDYGVAGDMVRLALFDAMGHDTAAGLTANLAVAACRNHRRGGGTLEGISTAVEEVLMSQFAGERYTTGVLAELDGATGLLRWVNRGHPPPFLIRDHRTVVPLPCPPAAPMGMGLADGITVCEKQLEPHDRLVLYTDGMTESRAEDGEEFGVDRLTEFLIRRHSEGRSVPESLRLLMRRHIDEHLVHPGDDATVVLAEWHGPQPFTARDVEDLTGLPTSSAEGVAGGPDSPVGGVPERPGGGST